MSARGRRRALEAVLDRSGVSNALARWMPGGGRPAQLPARTVILGLLIAIDEGRPAQLRAAHRALSSLEFSDRHRLSVTTTRNGRAHEATYRQFAGTHQVMTRAIDPSPVPSFRGVAENDRAEHLEALRRGVDATLAEERLHEVVDALVESSVPEVYSSLSSSVAVDWTDHETWSRPRAKNDPQPANDPDASFGHAKRNAPGAKDALFFGYYAQVVTVVRDEDGPNVPELVRRIALHAPRWDPAGVMADTLVRLHDDGVVLGDVLADCGYSHREAATFAAPLRERGASLVFDLHPHDRGPQGTHGGAICHHGNLYCPGTPKALFELGPLPRGASETETEAHDAKSAELARHKLGAISAPDEHGSHRVMCPAVMGKLRCPLRPSSLALSHVRPEVLSVPRHPPRCCTQQTLTVPAGVNERTAQKHDYPSAAHRDSYARRTGAERTFASLSDPSVGGIRRGWCRLLGRAKNTFIYALSVVVRNVRITESFEQARADEARRAAMGRPPRRRRRHRRSGGDTPVEAPPADHPSAPG